MASTELDPHSGVPLYRQVIEILRAEIVSGAVDQTEPMTEDRLLARFSVSRAPIRQALKELTIEGYVYRKQGKGTFPVVGPRIDRPANLKAGDLYRFLEESGQHPTSHVSGIVRQVPAPAIARQLDLPAAERVLQFRRIMAVEGAPFAVNDVYVRSPDEFLPTAEQLRNGGSAFALLATQFGLTLERAEHETWATAATSEVAAALGVPVGAPVLVIETVFFGTGGVAVGWRHAVHRGDSFKYRFSSQA